MILLTLHLPAVNNPLIPFVSSRGYIVNELATAPRAEDTAGIA
jgi:hypothetical protein